MDSASDAISIGGRRLLSLGLRSFFRSRRGHYTENLDESYKIGH